MTLHTISEYERHHRLATAGLAFHPRQSLAASYIVRDGVDHGATITTTIEEVDIVCVVKRTLR